MNARATLELSVVDGKGNDLPARVAVTDESGRFWAPDSAWIHADDGFDAKKQPFEAHYFHLTERSYIVVPTGKLKIDVMKGFEFQPVSKIVEAQRGDLNRVVIKLEPLSNSLPDASMD